MREVAEGADERPAPDEVGTGQGLVEYALILAFVAVVVLVVLAALRDRVDVVFSLLGTSLQ